MSLEQKKISQKKNAILLYIKKLFKRVYFRNDLFFSSGHTHFNT